MSAHYHIPTAPAPAPFPYPAAFRLLEHDDYVKYGHPVFEGRAARGDDHWTAEIITQTWYQAETGRIPISGAGYGGPFAGEGFDGIWLDMSEIVRPTRDGIHGRETISTTVGLGRRLPALSFDDAGRLTSMLPPLVELSLPVLFNPLPEPLPGRGPLRGLAAAAERLGTLMLLTPDDWYDDGSTELVRVLTDHAAAVAFRLTPDQLDLELPSSSAPRLVEIETPRVYGSKPAAAGRTGVAMLQKGRRREMTTVGYFEGTDPVILTRLAVRGVATLPLGNGVDGHGKYVNHLTKADGVSLVTGYLHKILPTSRQEFTPESVLFVCQTHDIPVLLIAPSADHKVARVVLGKVADYVTLVDPAELYEKIMEVIG